MIYLIRHGETAWNAAGRFQGQLDSPLTLRGIDQVRGNAATLRREIEDLDAFSLVCSPLGRAWQSAVIVADVLGIARDSMAFDARLKEQSYGRFQGLTLAEIDAAQPGAWDRREADKWNWQPPGGESYARLDARVGDWLAEQPSDSKLIVVCHGVVSRVMRGRYAGLTPEVTMTQHERQDCLWRLDRGRVETLLAEGLAEN